LLRYQPFADVACNLLFGCQRCPNAGDLPSKLGSDQAGDHASMIRQARDAAVIGRSIAPHLSQQTMRPLTSRSTGIVGVACADSNKSPPTVSPSGSDLMPVARRSKSSRICRPAGRLAMGIRLRFRLCSTRAPSGISPKKIFARESAAILL